MGKPSRQTSVTKFNNLKVFIKIQVYVTNKYRFVSFFRSTEKVNKHVHFILGTGTRSNPVKTNDFCTQLKDDTRTTSRSGPPMSTRLVCRTRRASEVRREPPS